MSQARLSSANGSVSGSPMRLVLQTLGVIACLALAWRGRVILMLLFASGIFATLLSAAVEYIRPRLKVGRGSALALLLATGGGVVCLTMWIRGPSIVEHFADLQTTLPQAAHKLVQVLRGYAWGLWLIDQMSGYAQTSQSLASAVNHLGGFVLSATGLIGGLVVILILGTYLAAEPQVYLSGLRRCFPTDKRTTFDACANSASQLLRWWLLSQILSMTSVGLIVSIGLWALGIPLAGTLGIIAALLTFIPNVGPILSVVPAVLLAVVISPLKAVLVIALFIAVHFMEGNVINPLLERKIVRLPPALVITAQLALAVIVGPVGVALAAPLTAVAVGVSRVLMPPDPVVPAIDVVAVDAVVAPECSRPA